MKIFRKHYYCNLLFRVFRKYVKILYILINKIRVYNNNNKYLLEVLNCTNFSYEIYNYSCYYFL